MPTKTMTTISSLFSPEPEQWGLRGDPFLWREMAEAFRNVPIPSSANALTRGIACMFEALTTHPLDDGEQVFVPRLAHGGMSSGHVSLEFWREVVDRTAEA